MSGKGSYYSDDGYSKGKVSKEVNMENAQQRFAQVLVLFRNILGKRRHDGILWKRQG